MSRATAIRRIVNQRRTRVRKLIFVPFQPGSRKLWEAKRDKLFADRLHCEEREPFAPTRKNTRCQEIVPNLRLSSHPDGGSAQIYDARCFFGWISSYHAITPSLSQDGETEFTVSAHQQRSGCPRICTIDCLTVAVRRAAAGLPRSSRGLILRTNHNARSSPLFQRGWRISCVPLRDFLTPLSSRSDGSVRSRKHLINHSAALRRSRQWRTQSNRRYRDDSHHRGREPPEKFERRRGDKITHDRALGFNDH